MTPTDLANRALSHVDTGGAQLDPISLAILLAVLSAVISHFVEKCLDRLDHRTVTAPTFAQRAQLRLTCLWFAGRQGAGRAVAIQAYEGLLRMGAGLSEAELRSVRAG